MNHTSIKVKLIESIPQPQEYKSSSANEQPTFSGKFVLNDEVVYIKQVIYSNPATIVLWSDGTKTICKSVGTDIYNPDAGLAFCILKKLYGATRVFDLLKDWVPTSMDYDTNSAPTVVTVKDVRKKHKKG